MLNIACVCVGDGFSPEYVETLYSMIRRNLAGGTRGRFTVLTDHPALFANMAGVQVKETRTDLPGWWAKLYLFQPGAFPAGERVWYFDLDTVITGPLDHLMEYPGAFGLLEDVYRKGGFQSSVMSWIAGTPLVDSIWDEFETRKANHPTKIEMQWPGGDQEFLERFWREYLPKRIAGPAWQPDFLQSLYPGVLRSYKTDCRERVPKGTSVVFFHGFPRPHQAGGWVADVWKISDENLFFAMNVKDDTVKAHVRDALTRAAKWIEKGPMSEQRALIVGGGPSLGDQLWRIKGYQLSGGVIYACNGAYQYLVDHGIQPDCQVIHDARESNVAFVPKGERPAHLKLYYASQCHPAVLDAAGDELVIWHANSETALEVIPKGDVRGRCMIAGGATVGLNAMSLAYLLGHRGFELFGFDSCYADEKHHAYDQAINDGELVLDTTADGEQFRCAPWMVQQAEQFLNLYEMMQMLGCDIFAHGEGLIQTLARNWQALFKPVDERAGEILRHLEGVPDPVGVEVGVFAGDLSKRLLRRPDLTLYMVDSWSQADNESAYGLGDFHGRLTQEQQDGYMETTHLVTRFARDRAVIVRETSVAAAEDFEDQSLDFVFIDADHSYEACRADILAWSPKVKEGGWISGHDFKNPNFPEWGVERAVRELFGNVEEGKNFTWFVQKPITQDLRIQA